MRRLSGALVTALFLAAGVAWSASSFTDPEGDDNAAPDIASVTVAESADGVIAVTVSVDNFQALPRSSWLNTWFDVDSDESTGDAGDEALVQYHADGTIKLFVWDGSQLGERPSTGIGGSFAAGALTLSVPKATIGAGASFGILVVSARAQALADQQLVSSDYAPDRGRSAYAGPALAAFTDGLNDHDAAPDVTSIAVSDAKDGWISFAITTKNYETLPAESVVVLSIDADNSMGSGDGGADVRVRSVGGEVELERWRTDIKTWGPDVAPTRVRARNAANVLTLDVHRSELRTTSRLGFAVVSADINTSAGLVVAVDVAPDDAPFYRYELTNKAALRLAAGKVATSPRRPARGARLTVSAPVRRSDTGALLKSGRVTCRVRVDGKRVRSSGRFASRRAGCTFTVPRSGRRIRGTMTVRAVGTNVVVRFSFRVR